MTVKVWTVAIGFVSGVLSGMFGIGGGVITTPALRMLLGTSELIAVGTPLPVILPSALTGAIAYTRRGLTDLRAGVTVGLVGSGFAVAGAILATRVGGRTVLVVTAALILYMSVDMAFQAFGPGRAEEGADDLTLAVGRAASQSAEAAGGSAGPAAKQSTDDAPESRTPSPRFAGLAVLGAVTGLYSGFLGLGGGFILVPMLSRWFRFPIKRAVGTSLVAVGLLAVPGTISHYLLGNVNPYLAGLLVIGVVPGALIGARITFGASERFVRIGFAAMLAIVGVLLAASELGWL